MEEIVLLVSKVVLLTETTLRAYGCVNKRLVYKLGENRMPRQPKEPESRGFKLSISIGSWVWSVPIHSQFLVCLFFQLSQFGTTDFVFFPWLWQDRGEQF